MNKKIVSVFLCGLLLTVVFSAFPTSSITKDNKLVLIRVNKDYYNFLISNNFEIVGSKFN